MTESPASGSEPMDEAMETHAVELDPHVQGLLDRLEQVDIHEHPQILGEVKYHLSQRMESLRETD